MGEEEIDRKREKDRQADRQRQRESEGMFEVASGIFCFDTSSMK